MKSTHPLEGHLGYWLRTLSNHVSKTFAARLEKHAVSVPQWVVLRTLFERGACSQRELLKDIAGDKGALSRMIERLVERGLVSQRQNEKSRREVIVTLTTPGRKLVPLLAKEADANDAAFFATLGERQKKEFLTLIQGLIEANRSDALGHPTD